MKNKETFEDLVQKKVQSYGEAPNVSFDAILARRNQSKGFAWFFGSYKWYVLAGVAAVFIALMSIQYFKGSDIQDQKRVQTEKTSSPSQLEQPELIDQVGNSAKRENNSAQIQPGDAKGQNVGNSGGSNAKKGVLQDHNFIGTNNRNDNSQQDVRKQNQGESPELNKSESNQSKKPSVSQKQGTEGIKAKKKSTTDETNVEDRGTSIVDNSKPANKTKENNPISTKTDGSKSATDDEENQLSVGQTGRDLTPNTGKRNNWNLSLMYGPSYAFRILENNGNMSYTLRESAEKPLYSHMGGITLGYQWNNHLGVSLGLMYHQRREENSFNYLQEQYSDRYESRSVKVIHPILGEIYVTETDTFTDTLRTEHTFSNVNRYNTISIPLGVEYSWYKGRFAYTIGAGTGINFRRATGYVMSTNTEVVDLESNTFAQRALGVNLHLQTSIAYAVNDQLSIFIQPRGSMFLSPTNGIGYALNQYDYNLNALVGVKYRF